MTEEIFVFGSNLAGIHGAGSARAAVKDWGAKYGVGVGRTGRSYAIPTKDKNITSMTVEEIKPYVDDFIAYAKDHPELSFRLVAIGCGLAGFTPREMGPLFAKCPSNVIMPVEFLPYRSNVEETQS